MPHTRRTLTLNKKWDIELTPSGNIKLTGDALATAQNVANEARLFTNDAYFAQDKGSPYFVISLGQRTNDAIARSYLRKSALRVSDVQEVLSVQVEDTTATNRTLKGDIQFRTVEDSKVVELGIEVLG